MLIKATKHSSQFHVSFAALYKDVRKLKTFYAVVAGKSPITRFQLHVESRTSAENPRKSLANREK